MTNERYAYGVLIGRMQPLHAAHQALITHALEHVDKLIILLGSATSPRTLRNPFTFDERKSFIEAAFPGETRLLINPLADMPYRDQEWVRQVQETVGAIIEDDHPGWSDTPPTVALVGSQKDSSGYYLNMFPRWGAIPFRHIDPINATDIRRVLFGSDAPDDHISKINVWVDQRVMASLDPILCQPWVSDVMSEYEWNAKHKKSWAGTPYPVNFVTVDAVVVCSGHVLLIRRKKRPGKGKWALPGGYLEVDETVADGTLRELDQETAIDVSKTLLRASLKERRIFDDPLRSDRGRVMTVASLYVLPNMKKMPRVIGKDDADDAQWVPRSSITEGSLFEDHYAIINVLTANI